MPDSRIIRVGEGFALQVGEETLPLYGYLTYQPEKGCYEDFKKAGVRLFFCTMYAGDRGINQLSGIRPFRSGFWKGYGQYDFSELDADLRRIVGDSRPGEIFIIPRLMAEVPSWWDETNPDELCRDAHGTSLHQSFHSIKWLEDAEQMLRDLKSWLVKSGWDRYVIGFHMAAGNTEEFLRPGHRALQMTDYSRPAQEAFRAWCREKYRGDLDTLNRCWRTAYPSFDGIRIPSPARRLFAAEGDLRSEEYEAQTIDYYAFMNEGMARAAVALCAAAKRVTEHRQVIGAFYGYLAGGSESGQHAARIVFESDEVDFIASPFVYTDQRGVGIDWQLQGAADSAALHGKPWFAEADVRTCLSRPISQCMKKADPYVVRAYDGPVWWGPDTAEGSLGQMVKAFSRALTNRNAIWWFDMWGGWYAREEFMAFHRKACGLYREEMLSGKGANASETVLFLDDAFFLRVKPGGEICARQNQALWKALGYLGAPYRMYMMDDFPLVDPSGYRMAVFASCFWDGTRLAALEKWKTGDRVLAFIGPVDQSAASGIGSERFPGLEDPDRRGNTEEEWKQDSQALYFTERRQPVPSAGAAVPVRRFKVQPGDVVLDEDELGPQAILRREADCSLYADTAAVPGSGRMRLLLNAAGGQIWTDGNDVIYAGGTHIAVHAASDGVKRIHIPGKGSLINELTGEKLPGYESYTDVRMKRGETLLLRIAPMNGGEGTDG